MGFNADDGTLRSFGNTSISFADIAKAEEAA